MTTEPEKEALPSTDNSDDNAGYAADSRPEPELLAGDEDAEELDTEAETHIPDPEPVAAPDWEARFKALEARISANAPAALPPEPEDDPWKGLADDYPDIAEPIKKLLARQQNQFGQALAEVRATAFEESMDAARPDWRDLRGNKEFGDWLQSNPAQQQAAQQPGVRAALSVLSAYETHKNAAKALKEKREVRLKAAEAAPTKGSRAPSLSDSLDGWAAT